MFLPENVRYSKDINIAPRRLLLCGDTGSGKTFQSIMTAPNPLYVGIEQGITDPRLVEKNVPIVPLYDKEYCEKVIKKSVISNAVLQFFKDNLTKFDKDQTPIVDSMTALQDEMQSYNWLQVNLAKKPGADVDGFDYWDKNLDFWIEFMGVIEKLPCNFIMTAHLEEVRNKDGGAFMYYSPMLQGKYKGRISQKFTDVVRIVTSNKKVGDIITTEYKWQVKPSDDFKIAKTRGNCNTMYIPASFMELFKL